MNRRSFIQSILAAGVAPYVVTTAGVLMPVRQIVSVEIAPAVAMEFNGRMDRAQFDECRRQILGAIRCIDLTEILRFV